jgi:hypothetical protein
MQEFLTLIQHGMEFVYRQDTQTLIALFITLYVLGIPGMLRNLRRQQWLEKQKTLKKRRRKR